MKTPSSMKLSRFLSTVFVSLFSFGAVAQSLDNAPLDPPYPRPPASQIRKASPRQVFEARFQPLKSDTTGMISKQSPVQSQQSRGTCSIFSATALLESLLIIKGVALEDPQFGLSEEWLEYVIQRGRTSGGSSSPANMSTLIESGSPEEDKMPYIGMEWKSVNDDPRALERCGKVPSFKLASCLLAHRSPDLFMASDSVLLDRNSPLFDPEFQAARADATLFQKEQMLQAQAENYFDSVRVKELLAKGVPVLLDVDFYYGAWNHRKAASLCHSNGTCVGRDMNLWSQGVVTYPETNSLDRRLSTEGANRAGHSVLIVGYDDTKEVTYSYVDTSGAKQTKTRKGVFYFKNSWGADSFGVSFELDGQTHSGYGLILQDYADEYGTYHTMSLDGPVQ